MNIPHSHDSRAVAARSSPPTLADVARLAGVSRQTVSNVVRGTGRVGEDTRVRVAAAIAETGFTPHRGAASLRSGRADRLAYLVPAGEPRAENTILMDFLQHLVGAAAQRGQQVLVVQADRSDVAVLDDVVRTRSVDGMVLSAVVEDDPRVTHLQRLGVRFVCFGRTLQGAWVDVDNRDGMRRATRAVLDLGHRRVAFVGYLSPRRWDLDREEGYSDAINEARLRRRVVTVDSDEPAAAIQQLLTKQNRPTALVTGSDVLAAACYAAAPRAGLKVGRDVTVVSFEGTTAATLLTPSLATMRIPLARISERIVARLLGESLNGVGEVLDTEFIPGESLSELVAG